MAELSVSTPPRSPSPINWFWILDGAIITLAILSVLLFFFSSRTLTPPDQKLITSVFFPREISPEDQEAIQSLIGSLAEKSSWEAYRLFFEQLTTYRGLEPRKRDQLLVGLLYHSLLPDRTARERQEGLQLLLHCCGNSSFPVELAERLASACPAISEVPQNWHGFGEALFLAQIQPRVASGTDLSQPFLQDFLKVFPEFREAAVKLVSPPPLPQASPTPILGIDSGPGC